ncbi:phospho-sugar mutase [Candidatus Protofrankia californiensis]|uniref:phospho-sugar mutase n=1 Tax=Candidatus Protofrankia californiensis TaxID=1839754 RepID=UPI003D350C2A
MNTAVVRRAAAGLAAWLLARQAGTAASTTSAPTGSAPVTPAPTASPSTTPTTPTTSATSATPTASGLPPRDDRPPPLVVVGADARHGSERFAFDSVRVLAGAGLRAALLPVPVPTPVLAFAVRHLGADAGIMVTASHNPATDNGYKVYLGAPSGDPANGAQIVAPVDSEIEAAIDAVGPAASLPLGDGWTRLGEEIRSSYVAAAADTLRTDGAGGLADVRVAYTPLHGVGADTFEAVFTRAGLTAPFMVAEQVRPDPDFPTVPFPNPEEPGVMDRVLALGRAVGADVVIANDPDADRCAVAVNDRILTGDEVGMLLAEETLRTRPGPVATTIVSSRALAALAAAHNLRFSETLTGFKWIMRAHPDLAFGYEEALGYAVAPDLVRDKDGITAALAVAGIAAADKRRGRTLLDRLDDLARRYGLYVTAQVSIRLTGSSDSTERISAIMTALRADPPSRFGDTAVVGVHDLAAPSAHGRTAGSVPPADVVVFLLADGGRVVVRPSGTEPKIKSYLEVIAPVDPGADAEALAAARQQADTRMATLRDAVRRLLLDL